MSISGALRRLIAVLLVASGFVLAGAPPALAALPKADIVFILDESGSMGGEIDDVRTQLRAVASAVAEEADARYALVGFGGGYSDAPPNEPRTRTDFTDAAGFAQALEQSGAFPLNGGGVEMGIFATTYALTALSGFRADAGTCAVLVSDEPPDFKIDLASDLVAATRALAERKATWYGVVATGSPLVRKAYGPDEGSLAHASGGAVFSIGSFRMDPRDVLVAVLSRCVRSVEEKSRCTITGTSGRDIIRGTPRRDVICGLEGDDVIYARGGNDVVFGGGGDDLIYAGVGDDRVAGELGDDRVVGGMGRDVLLGGGGADVLLGRRGNDVLRGGFGNDVLFGHSGRDRILGDRGRDRIHGRDGRKDVIRGGRGHDTAVLDAGLDDVRSVERLAG